MSSAAGAAPGPGLHWQTLHTPCCDVHFHDEARPQAERLAAIADESLAQVNSILNASQSQRTHIVISDATDNLNGFATSLPYNLVHIFSTPPDGEDDLVTSEDHMRMVLVHELFHVAHLDTIGGLPKLWNHIFGKQWPPNFLLPRWLHEGMATYAESRLTKAGRLRSSRWRSYLRLAALEGDLWTLDDVSNVSRRPPGGNAAYLYGAHFVYWLSQDQNHKWLAAFSHDYGSAAVPYGIARSLRRSSGIQLEKAWAAFVNDITREALATRKRVGTVTPARRLTRLGGTMARPFFSGDRLVFSARPAGGRVGFYAVDGLPDVASPALPLTRTHDAATAAALGDDIVYSQPAFHLGFWPWRDLFIVSSGRERRLTKGARLRDPSPGRPGFVLAMHTSPNKNAIVEVNIDTGNIRELFILDDGDHGYTPIRVGDDVVFSMQRFGENRDLYRFSAKSQTLEQLTDDVAEDTGPTLTPDGRHIVFAADRDGIFNLFAIERSSGRRYQITNLIGGAEKPVVTPDGRAVVFVGVHTDGSDLYVTDLVLADDHSHDRADPLHFPPRPSPIPSVIISESEYNPLPSLMPTSYAPTLTSDSLGGARIGVELRGEDAVQAHSWALSAGFGLLDQRPNLSLRYQYRGGYLPIGSSLAWVTEQSDQRRRNDGEPELHTEQIFRWSTDIAIPLRRFTRSHRLRFAYARTWHLVESPVQGPGDGRAPVYPPLGDTGTASLSWTYRETESYRDSISIERGIHAGATFRLANQFTLSDVDTSEFSLNLDVFQPVPGLAGHVVALYLAGGFAVGERGRRTTHVLGGFGQRDLVADLTRGTRFGGGILRGYPARIRAGDGFALATAEYRLPLFEFEQGSAAIPVQFHRMHLAFFVDVGDAFTVAHNFDQVRAGIGTELRFTMTFGYYARLLARIGFARGLMRGGIDAPYVVLGSPF